MKNAKGLLLGALLCALAPVVGAGIIGFDEGAATQTGTFSYDGSGGGAVGAGINFTTIDGIGTPANDGAVLECRSCFLDFVTGASTLEGPDTWRWGAGGSFTVTGQAFDGVTLIASGTLLSGVFGAAASGNLGLGSTQLFIGAGTDTKHPDLIDFYGYPADQQFTFAHTNLSLGSCSGSGDAFDCNVLNADLDNIAQVPIPGSLALMGLGLLGMAGRRWTT